MTSTLIIITIVFYLINKVFCFIMEFGGGRRQDDDDNEVVVPGGGGEFDHVAATLSGYQQGEVYWNPRITANFCEKNYAHSQYIAEFYNTWASFIPVVLGILGLAKGNATNEIRITVCYVLLVTIGIASAALHTTQNLRFETFVKLPVEYLLYSTTYMKMILMAEDQDSILHTVFVPSVLSLMYLLLPSFCFTFCTIIARIMYMFVGGVVIYDMVKAHPLPRNDVARKCAEKVAKLILYCWFPCWIADTFYCESRLITYIASILGGVTPRVLWYWAFSYGIYHEILLVEILRIRTLGKFDGVIRYYCKIIPFVEKFRN